MFFTSGMDQKFKVWDTNSLQVVDEHNLKSKIYNHDSTLLMSSNTKSLIALALDNGQVQFVDLISGSSTHTLKAHTHGYCVSVRWSPYNSNFLVSAGSDGRMALWDIRSSKSCVLYFDYEKSSKIKKSFKTSSSYAGLSSASSKSIAHGGPIIGATYTPDGNHLLSLGKDNHLRLWNASNGTNTLTNYGKIPLNTAVAEACLQLSCTDLCKENFVFVPSNKNLLMYNIFEGDLKNTFKGHFESVNCCAYNSSSNEIYTGSKDRNILIWSRDRQEIIDNLEQSNHVSGLPHSLISSTGGSWSGGAGSTSSAAQSSSESRGVKRQLDNWSDDDD